MYVIVALTKMGGHGNLPQQFYWMTHFTYFHTQKEGPAYLQTLLFLVGVAGFEPTASWSRIWSLVVGLITIKLDKSIKWHIRRFCLFNYVNYKSVKILYRSSTESTVKVQYTARKIKHKFWTYIRFRYWQRWFKYDILWLSK